MNVAVLGVSRDSLKSHKKFADKNNLPFSLLVDEDEMLHRQYDVLKEKKMFGKIGLGTERSTFIISHEGKLAAEFRNVKAKGHAAEVLEILKQQ